MSPAYFGMVMATGIVALAADQIAHPRIACALFTVAAVAYGVLWALSALRALRHPRLFFGDLVDHKRGPGFFTMIAASGVLGSASVVLADSWAVGFALWCVAFLLWGVLTYAIFAAFTVKQTKPGLAEGISGAWLLSVVGTQSIAVLAALLAAQAEQPWRQEMNFVALSMWLWGGMLYIWLMALIFYRYTFFRLSPDSLTPPYWINMGAMAISTLAGSLLIANAPDAPFLLSMEPFLRGFTVFYWASGTWWIPMLLILGVWRYVWMRFPLRYDPLYWGAVFPLGMYAVGTQQMTLAMDLRFMPALPAVFAHVAVAAWAVAFVAYFIGLRGGEAG
ncbi:C4-dicarboxylate ABC transporter [Roseovarius spongiae]|uniref:C4-dicarboxylate ABC transporter n=2 Tax=Roseovarius spongiae TaxID=2320272 RepID=A0A3A8AVH6_9RHOB|nr:C4-dicarboxylate ABC transporter [Roseovarius spongiae]